MASEELQLIRLKDDFYRDGFYKALSALGVLLVAICLLIVISIYFTLSKPAPVTFATGNDFRLLSAAPLSQPYIKQPDLIQWVSDAIPKVFTYDFVNYQKELQSGTQYFTDNGWKSLLAQLNVYASDTAVQNNKLFVNAAPAGAPLIQNQGVLRDGGLAGVYAWRIQMPLNISYSNGDKDNTEPLVVQVLVIRVPNLNNIAGVAIENIIVTKGNGNQVIQNG